MSGSPKMVTMYLEGQGYVTVTEAQAAALERTERARRKAAQEESERQQFAKKQEIVEFAGEVRQVLAEVKDRLAPAKAVSYENELNRLVEVVENSREAGTIHGAELSLRAMRHRLLEVRDSAEQQAKLDAAQDAFAAELAQFDARLNALRGGTGPQFDERGRTAALTAVNACRALLSSHEMAERQAVHATARRALDAHAAAVAAAREEWEAQRSQQAQLLEAAQQLAAGLAADELVQRWTAPQAAELAARVAGWQAAHASVQPSSLSAASLEQLRHDEAALLERVAAAQFKAEQRNYILASVREVLTEMGFVLGAIAEETPGHPATALRFTAMNAAGQSMNVSVPLEGEVWYDVDGFPKTTEAKVGGGTAAVCDSAQAVIEEMHSAIEAQFGIKSGELTWEGKDPLRDLRQADQLPRSDDNARGGTR